MAAREPSRWDVIQSNTDMSIYVLNAVRQVAERYIKENPEADLDDLEMLIESWLERQKSITADQWDAVAVSSTLEMVWEESSGED